MYKCRAEKNKQAWSLLLWDRKKYFDCPESSQKTRLNLDFKVITDSDDFLWELSRTVDSSETGSWAVSHFVRRLLLFIFEGVPSFCDLHFVSTVLIVEIPLVILLVYIAPPSSSLGQSFLVLAACLAGRKTCDSMG